MKYPQKKVWMLKIRRPNVPLFMMLSKQRSKQLSTFRIQNWSNKKLKFNLYPIKNIKNDKLFSILYMKICFFFLFDIKFVFPSPLSHKNSITWVTHFYKIFLYYKFFFYWCRFRSILPPFPHIPSFCLLCCCIISKT